MEPLLGNELVRSRLWRAAAEDRLHHCYLFEGPRGVGKARMALTLAMAANCALPLDRAPCGTCSSCRAILTGVHPDILIVEPEPGRATRILSVDQARAVLSALTLQRHSARRRFVILDPADALNEEAANALLKTLEEPPDGTHFFLISSRGAGLLPTVRSRSLRVRFSALPTASVANFLVARGHDPSHADRAEGSLGRALELVEDATARAELLAALLGAIGQPLHRLFSFTEERGKKEAGDSLAEAVVNLVEELLRDVVVVAQDPEGSSLTVRPLYPEQRPLLLAWAAALWPGGVARMGAHLQAARERLRSNVNGRVVLEALLSHLNLELAAAPRRPPGHARG